MKMFLLTFPVESIIFLIIVLYFIYKWMTQDFDYFAKKAIPFEKPLPFVGNSWDIFFQKKSVFDVTVERYEKLKHEKIFGLFEMRRKLYGITDPELIKLITIKDFDHFVNRRTRVGGDDDSLFGNSLFALRDQKWKDMRSTLSPAFTGNKMRLMFELIEEVSRTAIEHLKSEASKNDPLVVDMRDFFTRFTADVIGSAAFGLQINSLTEKDNEFYRNTRKAIDFTGFTFLKMFLFSTIKPVMKLLKISFTDKNFAIYLRQLILDTMKHRSENNIVRRDMINLLMEAREGALEYEKDDGQTADSFAAVSESSIGLKKTKRAWTDTDIVAQCFIFLIAGFEPTATAMSFCAYELTENRDVQQKLIKEIDEVQDDLKGEPLTYNKLQSMKYMDMVISETLRKWPTVNFLDRQCVKPYTLHDPVRKREILLESMDSIWIPVTGIHRDPDYYPNPLVFDPERFNDLNKHKIRPYTYLPFGVGPRNCIGSRFALMEIKAIVFHLLSHFTFEISDKTKFPIKLAPSGFTLKTENGFWINLKARSNP